MTKVKICGIRSLQDVLYCNELLPDYVGFVFAESRRMVSPAIAAELRCALAPAVIPVGVFVNAQIETIAAMYNTGLFDIAQLHGNETDEYIGNLKSECNTLVIKAVKPNNTPCENADFALLDGEIPGSGTRVDYDAFVIPDKPVFLAGGLNAENVGGVIQKYWPFAVDVSGGVETDGIKDYAKMKEFIRKVKENG